MEQTETREAGPEQRALAGTDLTLGKLCLGSGAFESSVPDATIDAVIGGFRDGGGNFMP